jgi:hypothetical protein
MKNLMLVVALAFGMTSVYAADPKPAPKLDCTKPANKNKGPCQKAPESKTKVEIKKPEKKKAAPAATQKKAAENNAQK